MSYSAGCSSCGATITWAKTPRGKWIPLDPEPAADGNVELVAGVAHVVGNASASLFPRTLYKSHFATCPNAAQHRRGNK